MKTGPNSTLKGEFIAQKNIQLIFQKPGLTEKLQISELVHYIINMENLLCHA